MFEDRYELKAPLGKGAMGSVYLAYDKKLNKNWAVKVIPKRLERPLFEKNLSELDALKMFNHKNLPRIVDVFENKNSSSIVMDYVDGRSLKDRLQKGDIGASEAWQISEQICQALIYMHRHIPPVIHGDLKPANIICALDGTVKLVDFGSCISGNQSQLKHISGTLEYMAPECFKGIVNTQTDIFALGKVLKDIMDVSGIRISHIVKKCTNSCAKQRYISVSEVRQALFRSQKSRHWGLCIIAACALLVGIRNHKTQIPEIIAENDTDSFQNEMPEEVNTAENTLYEAGECVSIAGQILDSGDDNRLYEAVKLLEENQERLELLLDIEKNLKAQEEEKAMEYKIENMAMLSTIYRLLGKKDIRARHMYYEKAERYIEELLDYPQVKESSLYRLKLSDLVNIKEEMGRPQEAIAYLEEWENENPDSGKELYFAHACLLLKEKGQKHKLEKLYKRMKKSKEVVKDYRFAEIARQIEKYLED